MKQAVIFLGFFLSGCVSFFPVPSHEALQNPPPMLQERWETELIHSEFSVEALNKNGMALFAILERGAPDGLRQSVAFEVFQGLRSFFPDLRVIPRTDAVRKIKSAEKQAEYKAFFRRYQEGRSMDVDGLREWGRIEEVRYLFIGEILFNDKHTATRTMQKAERGVGGLISVFSSGPSHIPVTVYKRVSLRGELWDSECGKAVWIGTSQSEVTEPGEKERVRVEDILNSTSRNLIAALDKALKKNLGSSKPKNC
ncbi:MAG: hypothetical protein ABGX83_00135 [Nitrospira sp.]|nr:hypothetical protein [Candidatus Manganitrophaceae bacterium]HIL34931.1 hypothetical protein [Candidatus Manganitrophaceae bacterium]